MNILNFTISYSLTSGNLYSDLNEALVKAGHNVKVVFADPSLKSKNIAEKTEKCGVEVLRVKALKVQKVGLIYKALSFIMLPFLLKRAVKKYYSKEHFDLILFSAPPVTLYSVVAWAKKHFKCKAFLMQKDIFPQNAVDLKMFSKYSLPYFYFRNKEKKMLKIADAIGCMSQGNIEYIIQHNKYVDYNRVFLFPNTMSIPPVGQKWREHLCKKFDIPANACIFLFAGNMGKPQYLDLLEALMKNFKGVKDIFFLCIGSGFMAYKIKDAIKEEHIDNAIFLDFIPREEFSKISESCDVGLVILDPNFTIPNYPSKTLSYMSSSIPILAATDKHTDYRKLVEEESKCGIWCPSSDFNAVCKAVEKLAGNPQLRQEFGANGRAYLEKNFNVTRSVEIIEKHFGND